MREGEQKTANETWESGKNQFYAVLFWEKEKLFSADEYKDEY